MRLHYVVEPALQGRGGARIALSDDFDPVADLPGHQNAQEDGVLVDALEPASDVGIGARPLPKLRDDVGVNQEALHNETRRPTRRARAKSESRPTAGIPRSIAFKDAVFGESNACLRISRCSASAECPRFAARCLRRATTSWGMSLTMSCAIL